MDQVGLGISQVFIGRVRRTRQSSNKNFYTGGSCPESSSTELSNFDCVDEIVVVFGDTKSIFPKLANLIMGQVYLINGEFCIFVLEECRLFGLHQWAQLETLHWGWWEDRQIKLIKAGSFQGGGLLQRHAAYSSPSWWLCLFHIHLSGRRLIHQIRWSLLGTSSNPFDSFYFYSQSCCWRRRHPFDWRLLLLRDSSEGLKLLVRSWGNGKCDLSLPQYQWGGRCDVRWRLLWSPLLTCSWYCRRQLGSWLSRWCKLLDVSDPNIG